MYYKYFIDKKTTFEKIKEIAIWLLKSVIYAAILTIAIAYAIGFRPIYIIGDSMTPTIMKHDLILIKPVERENIKVDDVITYKNSADSSGMTTHRIFRMDGEYFRTIDEPTYLVLKAQERGETVENPVDYETDGENIPYEWVLGKVIHVLPGTGAIVEYLTINGMGQKINFFRVAEVLFTLVGIYFIFAIFKQEDRYESVK